MFCSVSLIAGTSVQATDWLLRLYQPFWTGCMQDLSIFGFTLRLCEARKVAKRAQNGSCYILFREQPSPQGPHTKKKTFR